MDDIQGPGRACAALALLLGLAAGGVIAAPETDWAVTFGGPCSEWGAAARGTPDGGYIIAGEARSTADVVSSDIWIVKANSTGGAEWEKRIGGDRFDSASSVITAAGSGYVIAGTTHSFSSGGGSDAWLIRIDPGGTELWNRSYGGAGTEGFEAVVQTADGGFAAAGVTSSFGSGGDMFLVRTDGNGNGVWYRNYGGQYSDRAMGLARLNDGGFILAGWTVTDGYGGTNVSLVRTDADGQVIWKKVFGHDRTSYGNDILALAEGGFLAVGYTDPYPSAGRRSVYAVRTDEAGEVIWEATPANPRTLSEGRSVTMAPGGGYLITGSSLGVLVLKLDTWGTTEWETVIAASPNDRGSSIETTGDGGIIIGGSREQAANNHDYLLARIKQGDMPIEILPLPGCTDPPADSDSDGIFEDLNANGRKDLADVVLYFSQMAWIAAHEPVAAFDLNSNGRIDFADIVALFGEI